ncbi:MAG: hypothetical protein HOY79_01520 [Streptomyces sp.]|nr:hypothetical protein [Streptomyces sp.]
MATPQQPTPGDRREDHAQATADAVAAIYAQAELVLIATIAALARKTALGAMTAEKARQKLAQTTRAVLVTAAPRIQTALDDGLTGAHAGVRGTVSGILRPAAAERVPTPDAVALAQSLDDAAATAATSAQKALTAATSTTASDVSGAFTPHQLAVARAIESTRGGAPYSSLSLSRIQAAQKALDDLGEQGITGFTDRTGRRWNLVSYVEMATRTAVSNAWDDLQTAAMTRSGLDLVEVSTHSTEGSCSHCLPWLGRTLSLTGSSHGYPTLDDAKDAGFRHPSCRCFWTPLGAGVMADVTNPVPVDRAAAVYKASQRQRALERRVREAARRQHAAITPAARSKARRDLAQARAASEAHRSKTGLRMTQASVKRREHPHRAH